MRDSPYVLDGLLEQQTSLRPTQLMTDPAGYSDIIFALFWLLGYQFSPRLADLGETRFWRLDPEANYRPLSGLARNRVKPALISRNWDDFLQVAGSLKMGTVRASEFIRSLQRSGKHSLLGLVWSAAIMRSRELDPEQNTARFLKVSNVMSVGRYA